MASYKDYKSISAAKKAGSIYYTNKAGKKMLAVTKEDLDSWKKKNKGNYKGSALTAWANAKGKSIKPTKPKPKPLRSSLKPKERPSSVKRITKAPKKKDPEAKTLGTLTILQIQKKPGVMTIMEELQVKKANLENRIDKAKKAGTKDLGAEASLRVINRRIKAFKEKNK